MTNFNLNNNDYSQETNLKCSIESVYLPSSVKYIGCSAFADCKNLETVILPTSTDDNQYRINEGAFYECSKLTKFNYLGTIEQWNKITKYNQWDYGTADYIVYCNDGNLTKEEVNA